MADNVTITGSTIATDDVAGVQFQRIKVAHGVDGTANDATSTSPLPAGQHIYDGAAWQQRRTGSAIVDGAPGTFFGTTALHLYNGTTYDRARGDVANGLDVDVTRVQGTVTTTVTGSVIVDSELPPAIALSDALSNPTAPAVGAYTTIWNGTTWSRVKDFTATSNATTQTGVQPVHPMVSDGTSNATSRAVGSAADANPGSQASLTTSGLFNGSTIDRARGNTEGTLLAPSSRTSTTTSPVQTNHNSRGLIIHLNVTTAVGSESLIPRLFYRDPVSGVDLEVWSGTALTTTGLRQYLFYPGGDTGSAIPVVIPVPVPRTFYVQVSHSAASSWTYSVGYSLIV